MLPAIDTSPTVLYLGRDAWVRLRLPGAPSTHRRPARIGSIASASQRFAAALTHPPEHRMRVRGPEPVRPTSLRGATTSPPRWWHPGLVPSEERADWVRALRPSTAARPTAETLPARGLPRAARSVPDEETWTPGGIVSTLVAQVAAVRRHTEVAAAGPMLTSHDRAKLAATEAARPRPDNPAVDLPAARPASPPTRGHDPPKLGHHRSPPAPTGPTWQPARPSRLSALTPRATVRPSRGEAPTDPSGWRELIPGRARTATKVPDRTFFSVALGFDRFASKTRARESQLNRVTQPSTELRPAMAVSTAPAAPVAIPVTSDADSGPTTERRELVPGGLRAPATAPARGFFSVALSPRFASLTRGRDSALNRVTGPGSALNPAQSVASAPARPVAVPVRPPSDSDAPAAPVIGSHRLAAVPLASSVVATGITLGAHRRRTPPPPAEPAGTVDGPVDAPVGVSEDTPVVARPARSTGITLAATRSLASSQAVDEPIRPATAITTAVAGPRMIIGGQRLVGAGSTAERARNGNDAPKWMTATRTGGPASNTIAAQTIAANTITPNINTPTTITAATIAPSVMAPTAFSRLAGSLRGASGWVGQLGRDLSAAAERQRDATTTELTVAARSAKATTARSVNRLARALGASTDIVASTATPAAAGPSGPVRLPGSVLTYAPGTEPGAPPPPVITRPRRDADAASFRYVPAPPPMAPSRPPPQPSPDAGPSPATPSGSSLFGRLVPGPGGGLRRSLLDITADLFAKTDRDRTSGAEPTGAVMSPDARDLVRAGPTAVTPRPEPSALTDARLMQELVDRVVERIEDKVVDELERRGRRYNPGVF